MSGKAGVAGLVPRPSWPQTLMLQLASEGWCGRLEGKGAEEGASRQSGESWQVCVWEVHLGSSVLDFSGRSVILILTEL